MITPSPSALPLAVVAVVAGEGLEAIFRDFGVARIVNGGQATNPSIGELLAAIQDVDAREILLLPNNPNVILAARQVAGMAGRPVEIVPTRNAAEGFAALLALDPTEDAAANVAQMTAAARAIQTLAVTEAVRDSTIGARKVKRGQVIALDPDEGLVAVDGDPERAVRQAVKSLKPGYELLTIYYGDGSSLADAEAMAKTLGTEAGGVEVEVVHGGQPYYRYLIAAE
jgi:dihydroxyacetone kinase-like predicted kinase